MAHIKHIKDITRVITRPLSFPLLDEDLDHIDQLKQVLRHHPLSKQLEGLAIAAPQININKPIFLIGDLLRNDDYRLRRLQVFINPSIQSYSSATDLRWEGCLSYPSQEALVRRPIHIHVQYQNIRGKSIHQKMTGTMARVFQHEYEHLQGTSFQDSALEFRPNPLYCITP